MTQLQQLKEAYDEIGIYYKESIESGYTYISRCSEEDTWLPVNSSCDEFIEFDENGAIASY